METNNQKIKNWFLYVRKSTDEEGYQVLSIEAQITELKESAERENLEISEIFVEKKTAKIPGREVFNEMVSRIETSKIPVGILAWHPDRLSRNSIDGGRIIYLLDAGKLAGLKFPTFSFENTPAGKFFLSIALSNAKYYIDNLSENVKRGNRQKLRRGEWPGQKPLGYIYDHRLRNIVPDPKTAKIVQRIFREFATGKYSLESISQKLARYGITSKNGKPRSNSSIYNLLTHQLYIGIMKWKDEVYEGRFQPIVSKDLFDKVQEILKQRGKPRKKKQRHNFPFCGLFRCSCGAAITAQWAKGNGGLYRYYRCTRKFGPCKEKYIQEKELVNQICQKLKEIALPENWTKGMLTYLKKEEEKENQSGKDFIQKINQKLMEIQNKLDKLLEGYLDGLIEEENYKRKKEELIQQKVNLKSEKEMAEKKKFQSWIEPTRNFLKTAFSIQKVISEKSLEEIRQIVEKVGTNHIISNKKVTWDWQRPYDFLALFLASPARWRGEPNEFSRPKKLTFPVWWALEDLNIELKFRFSEDRDELKAHRPLTSPPLLFVGVSRFERETFTMSV